MLIDVNSYILISFSWGEIFGGILNFSEPAKSTIFILDIFGDFLLPLGCVTSVIWKIECDLELFVFPKVGPVTRFLGGVIN